MRGEETYSCYKKRKNSLSCDGASGCEIQRCFFFLFGARMSKAMEGIQ